MSKEAEAIESARRKYVAAMHTDKEHAALMALIREVQKAKGK